MKLKILIKSKEEKIIMCPSLKNSVTFTTMHKGVPGRLDFSAMLDDALKIKEGDEVLFSVNGKEMFYGVIFTRKLAQDGFYNITAYDQLRYFKNKDIYMYENKSASQVLEMICKNLDIKKYDIAKTEYIIPNREEIDKTLWDIINTALELERNNKGNIYLLYDDCGKITLKKDKDLITNILICEKTAASFDYSISIDSNTYNKVKTFYRDKKLGAFSTYIAEDAGNIKQWGPLQLCSEFWEDENGQVKADSLLKLHNLPVESLKVNGCFGHVDVRAGCSVIVQLIVGNKKLNSYMSVESCIHSFSENEHVMDLILVR